MSGMSYIHSRKYGENICCYVSDLDYSFTVLGCGYNTGKAYNITFDEDSGPVEIEAAE